jgi:hypothetical protein
MLSRTVQNQSHYVQYFRRSFFFLHWNLFEWALQISEVVYSLKKCENRCNWKDFSPLFTTSTKNKGGRFKKLQLSSYENDCGWEIVIERWDTLNCFTVISKVGHCATSRKVAGSIPDGVFEILHCCNCFGRTIGLGPIQTLTEMNTWDLSWGIKTAGAWGWQTCHLRVPTIWKPSTCWSPWGLSRPVQG